LDGQLTDETHHPSLLILLCFKSHVTISLYRVRVRARVQVRVRVKVRVRIKVSVDTLSELVISYFYNFFILIR
jgi:hypothetical protein